MKENEMLSIFDFENILINVIDQNRFEEIHDQYEDFYKLECRDGVWSLILKIQERRRAEKIEKSFKNKDEAIRYFCFYKLRDHFFDTYLEEVIYDNDIGTDSFTIAGLVSLYHELGISDELYGINSLKENAVNLVEKENEKYIVILLDREGRKILETLEMDKARAIFFMFKWVYLIHLMKAHVAEMQKRDLLPGGLTTEDYKILLS